MPIIELELDQINIKRSTLTGRSTSKILPLVHTSFLYVYVKTKNNKQHATKNYVKCLILFVSLRYTNWSECWGPKTDLCGAGRCWHAESIFLQGHFAPILEKHRVARALNYALLPFTWSITHNEFTLILRNCAYKLLEHQIQPSK